MGAKGWITVTAVAVVAFKCADTAASLLTQWAGMLP